MEPWCRTTITSVRLHGSLMLRAYDSVGDARAYYDTVSEARASIGRYLELYNRRRLHSSLDDRTPDQAYFTTLPIRLAT